MRVGIIGLGMVGGTLADWFIKNTSHIVYAYDPGRKLNDSFENVDAVFICIPVRPSPTGQDLKDLTEAVEYANKYTRNVFVRSTVLPGTCDKLGVTAMPEFLTARRADEDMAKLPVLVGPCDELLLKKLFPNKEIIKVSNSEAELAKYTHNVFGALKVTYFNIIYGIAQHIGANFENVKRGAFITGFIEKEHTQVPGPDGKFGYGGACFPENVESLTGYLSFLKLKGDDGDSAWDIAMFTHVISRFNKEIRGQE